MITFNKFNMFRLTGYKYKYGILTNLYCNTILFLNYQRINGWYFSALAYGHSLLQLCHVLFVTGAASLP